MIIADLEEIAGRTYPARRKTQNLVGGASPIQGTHFALGYVTLEPRGGQVPWHNQEQEEIYFVAEGAGEMCLGEEKRAVKTGQAVYIPPRVFHQLTNTGDTPMTHDLLLRPGRRRGALAAGIGGHASARRCRSSSAPRGRASTMHGETAPMSAHTIGVIMNGVTGRMGLNQHLRRSIYAIIEQGGVRVSETETILPKPLLVGRNAAKLEAISREFGGLPYTTDLDAALKDKDYSIYFDAQTTDRRAEAVRKAIAAGKHIYCEKPIAVNTSTALELYKLAQAAGVKHGVVQDKLWLPGMMKLKTLRDLGFFGRIFRCAASSAIGCSRAMSYHRSGRPGTTARKTAAASSSTCCATGATCSTICSDR